MKKTAIAVAVLAVVALCAFVALRIYSTRAARNPAFFEPAIVAFEEADRASPPSPGGIVFVGSSSIRFWRTLDADMAPLTVLNRGFGGAHFSHVLHNASRVVVPYAPRAVVVYVGDNDIAAGKPAESVVDDYRAFVALTRGALPEVEIYFLSIKPSELRWALWPEMSRANVEIEAITQGDPALHYIDVATPLLDAKGEPREDVFVLDGLHLNATGYAAWTEVVAPVLHANHPEPTRSDR